MDRLNLQASERIVLGKKVKTLRKDGLVPAHVFGKGVDSEHVSVQLKDFIKTFAQSGETGLIDLKIGAEQVRPVMVRGVQLDPVTEELLHVDFYQVDLKEKVKVPVPLELIGEEPERVRLGEAIVLQTMNEVEVEALPTDLVEKIEVDISTLKNIDDAISVGQLNYDKDKLAVLAEEDEVIVKLAPAVTAEMEQLLEEQAAEAAEAQAEAAAEEGAEAKEGEAPAEGEEATEGEQVASGSGEESPKEEPEQ